MLHSSISRFNLFSGLLSFSLVLMTLTLGAQDFVNRYENPLLGGGRSTFLDYDGDGDPDLITGGVLKNGEGATVLYRNDHGQFVDTDQTFDNFSGAVYLVDLENDGDTDVYIYNGTKHEFRNFKNEDGVFTRYQIGTGVYQFQQIDFDFDNDPDFIYVKSTGIVLLRNNAGVLHFESLMTSFPDVEEVKAADFNNDGNCDLLVKRRGAITLYLNNNGSFVTDESNTFLFPSGSMWHFDYDDDGDIDILLIGKTDDNDTRTGYLYENNAGVFSLVDGEPLFEERYPRLRDLDGDGDADVYKYNAALDSIIYYENQTDKTFKKIPVSSPLYEFKDLLSVSYANAVDEPANSYMCISGQIYNGNYAMYVYQKNDGVYHNLYASPFAQLHSAVMLAWVDYNKDGLLDAYLTGRSGPGYGPYDQLMKNTGTGFEKVYEFETPSTDAGEWLDFNNDGEIDFLTVISRKVVLYEGFNSPAGVTSSVILSNVSYDSFIKAIDFDQDGDMDIYVGGYMEGIYVNNNGSFSKSITFTAGYRDLGLGAWADYDLDGDEDLVMNVNAGGYDIMPRFYTNNSGTLTRVTNVDFLNLYAGNAYAIDYNLDEYPDLLITSTRNDIDKVALYKNEGGSTFTHVSVPVFSSLADMDWYETHAQIVDFNNDGYPDIMITSNGNSGSPLVKLFANQQDGTFALYEDHGITELRDMNFAWGDFDNDGDLDILLNGYYQGLTATHLLVNAMKDEYPPVITRLFPHNGSTLKYDKGYDLTITFHEPVHAGDGLIRFFNKQDNTLIAQVNASSSAVTIENNLVHVHLTDNPFEGTMAVYITVDGSGFSDFNNHTSAGIDDPNRWGLVIDYGKQQQNISFSLNYSTLQLNASPELLSATASSGLAVTYESSNQDIAVIENGWLKPVGIGMTTITASQPGNDVYYPAPEVSYPLEITKQVQTITFYPLPPGNSPFELSAFTSSGLAVSYTSTNQDVAVIEDSQVIPIRSGTTTIIAQQPGNDVFAAATPVEQPFSVVKGAQQITFDPLPVMTMGDEPFVLSAKASSGLTVSYKSSNLSVATVTDATVTLIAAGETTITAIQTGSDLWSEASPIPRQLVVDVISGTSGIEEAITYLYPNPAREFITVNTVTLGINPAQTAQLYIVDVQGRSQITHECIPGETYTIPLTALSNGVYTLKIMQHDKILWKRFVKE